MWGWKIRVCSGTAAGIISGYSSISQSKAFAHTDLTSRHFCRGHRSCNITLRSLMERWGDFNSNDLGDWIFGCDQEHPALSRAKVNQGMRARIQGQFGK